MATDRDPFCRRCGKLRDVSPPRGCDCDAVTGQIPDGRSKDDIATAVAQRAASPNWKAGDRYACLADELMPVLPEGLVWIKISADLKQPVFEARVGGQIATGRDGENGPQTGHDVFKPVWSSPWADDGELVFQHTLLTTNKEARKHTPIYSGCIKYFPRALAAVAALSQIGNEQHNPGTPLHWDRSKSGDELDALTRHLFEAGTFDDDGVRHSTKVAWRSLANLEKELEACDAGISTGEYHGDADPNPARSRT